MARKCFDYFLSDDEMRVQLERGETLFFKLSKWQEIERQVERLGFEDCFIVTQVSAKRGEWTKLTPSSSAKNQDVRHAA